MITPAPWCRRRRMVGSSHGQHRHVRSIQRAAHRGHRVRDAISPWPGARPAPAVRPYLGVAPRTPPAPSRKKKKISCPGMRCPAATPTVRFAGRSDTQSPPILTNPERRAENAPLRAPTGPVLSYEPKSMPGWCAHLAWCPTSVARLPKAPRHWQAAPDQSNDGTSSRAISQTRCGPGSRGKSAIRAAIP